MFTAGEGESPSASKLRSAPWHVWDGACWLWIWVRAAWIGRLAPWRSSKNCKIQRNSIGWIKKNQIDYRRNCLQCHKWGYARPLFGQFYFQLLWFQCLVEPGSARFLSIFDPPRNALVSWRDRKFERHSNLHTSIFVSVIDNLLEIQVMLWRRGPTWPRLMILMDRQVWAPATVSARCCGSANLRWVLHHCHVGMPKTGAATSPVDLCPHGLRCCPQLQRGVP